MVTSADLIAPNAFAEATEAERRTARDLFLEAYEIQKVGRFGEALEKYERSLSLFQAPTTLYRIAQCQAALGKWVEASESYRAAAAMPVAENASAAFKEAQANANAERAALESRTPTLTVDVTPHEGPVISWSIDGEPFKAALLGTPIRLNPGTRRIQVSASGYESAEQSVTLKERDRRTIRIALAPQASLPVEPPPRRNGGDELPPVQGPPPELPAVPQPAAPAEKGASNAFLLGVRGGAMMLNGGPSLSHGNGDGLFTGFGGHVAGDIGFRFGKVVIFSAYLDFGVLRGPEANTLEQYAAQNVAFTTSAKTLGFGLLLSLVANPSKPSFYFELGGGSRRNMLTVSRYDSTSGTTIDSDYKFTGPEGVIGMGVWLPLGRSFALLPKVSFSAGVLNKLECTSTSACPLDPDAYSAGAGLPEMWNKSAHTMVLFNLASFYSLNF